MSDNNSTGTCKPRDRYEFQFPRPNIHLTDDLDPQEYARVKQQLDEYYKTRCDFYDSMSQDPLLSTYDINLKAVSGDLRARYIMTLEAFHKISENTGPPDP